MIVELELDSGPGGSERSSNWTSWSSSELERGSRDVRQSSPARSDLDGAQLELGQVDLVAAAGVGHLEFEVRERQLGVAAQASATSELVDVGDPELPGAAVHERADLAVLGLRASGPRGPCPGRGRPLRGCRTEPSTCSSRSSRADSVTIRRPFGSIRWDTLGGVGREGPPRRARRRPPSLGLDAGTIASMSETEGGWLLNPSSFRSYSYLRAASSLSDPEPFGPPGSTRYTAKAFDLVSIRSRASARTMPLTGRGECDQCRSTRPPGCIPWARAVGPCPPPHHAKSQARDQARQAITQPIPPPVSLGHHRSSLMTGPIPRPSGDPRRVAELWTLPGLRRGTTTPQAAYSHPV